MALGFNWFGEERQQSQGAKGTKAKVIPVTDNGEGDVTAATTTQQLASDPSSVLCSWHTSSPEVLTQRVVHAKSLSQALHHHHTLHVATCHSYGFTEKSQKLLLCQTGKEVVS